MTLMKVLIRSCKNSKKGTRTACYMPLPFISFKFVYIQSTEHAIQTQELQKNVTYQKLIYSTQNIPLSASKKCPLFALETSPLTFKLKPLPVLSNSMNGSVILGYQIKNKNHSISGLISPIGHPFLSPRRFHSCLHHRTWRGRSSCSRF